MRSLLLLFSLAAACVSFGHASLVVREVEERLSSEQLRAELGFTSGAYVCYIYMQLKLLCGRKSDRFRSEALTRSLVQKLNSHSLLLLSLDVLPAHALVQVDLSDSARSRRDAGEEVPMTVDVLGHNITVDLAPNSDLLPPSYVLQTVGENGTLRTIPSHVRRDCYYTGHVEGMEGSHVAVQMCEGHEMVGWHAFDLNPAATDSTRQGGPCANCC